MTKIPEHIVSAIATDLIAGTHYSLGTKIDSGCHFFDLFSVDGYDIQLHLDWTDLDSNSDPMLDADFFQPGNTKPIKAMKKLKVHHTPKMPDKASGKYVYDFEFGGSKFRLMIQTTNQQKQSGTARIIAAKPEKPEN